MYVIWMGAYTSGGRRLDTVILRHAPEDGRKVAMLSEAMERDGWRGRPVILAEAGDGTLALTGSHRLAAAIGRNGIAAVWLPSDLTAGDWSAIEEVRDDAGLLAAFEAIAAGRDDMAEIVSAMRAETEAVE